MPQLPTSHSRSGEHLGLGPRNAFSTLCKPGKETLTEQLTSFANHQNAQTVNSELCIVRQ